MRTGDVEAGEGRAVRTVKRRSRFFLIASALMTLIVFAGFLPSFFLRFQFRTEPLPLYLIVHGLIMTAWQLLFLAQSVLVATGRTSLHRQLGLAGAGLAVAVVLVGVYATVSQPARMAQTGVTLPFPVEILVIGNLFGFALFSGFVAAAIVQRRNTSLHKRLMYWAMVVTMGPALTPARSLGEMILPFFPTTFPPEVALVWVAWIAQLIHDWLSARSFHPATIIGGILILFVGPALVDWTMMIDAVSAWARSLAN